MFTLRGIMTKDVVTAKANTPVIDVVKMLNDYNVSGLPIVDDDMKLVGIFTEFDSLALMEEGYINKNVKVNEYMSKNVISFSEDSTVIEVANFFKKTYKRRVPITADGKVVGLVSRRDIVKLILSIQGIKELSDDANKLGELHRVLVVDDSATNQKLIVEILKEQAICKIASCGEEAMEEYKHSIEKGRGYQVILLDIAMPAMDGLEVLNRIRKLEESAGVPKGKGVIIIMLTAFQSPHDDAFALGCDDYMMKPVNGLELIEKINKCLFNRAKGKRANTELEGEK